MLGGGVVVLLQALDELVEHLLGHLAAPALQVGESGQPEAGLQVVGDGVEGPPQRQRVGVLPQLELDGAERVLLH